MADTVTGVLKKDHDRARAFFEEFKHALQTFNLPRLRYLIDKFRTILKTHTMKEEAVLYLVLFKHMKFTDKSIPELYVEHTKSGEVLDDLERRVNATRLTNVEAEIEGLGMEWLYSTVRHMDEEEQIVWPLAEKLLSPEEKNYCMDRYRVIEGDLVSLARQPLVTLIPRADQRTQDTAYGIPN